MKTPLSGKNGRKSCCIEEKGSKGNSFIRKKKHKELLYLRKKEAQAAPARDINQPSN
jgi:hypothetical protein